jgi:C1A family cysteine protease
MSKKTKEVLNIDRWKRGGWLADRPDQRDDDHAYQVKWDYSTPLPTKVDHRPTCPAIKDQGQLGSCVPHGIAFAMEYDELRQHEVYDRLSPLGLYYLIRVMEGTIDSDSGCMIRDGAKTVNKTGAGPESLWPYDIAKFTEHPPQGWYDAAKKSITYHSVPQSLQAMKGVLADGNLITIGFTVYQSFESQEVADTGVVPMPARHESVLGGHCVDVVGYDDSRQVWICANSWGTSWGDKGYFYMPYSYLTSRKLSSDFWVINTVQ